MKKYVAEFIGTFVLVFVACGVAAVTGCTAEPNVSYLMTALAFGGALSCVWVFIVAPLIGGALAACIWRAIRTEE